MYKRTIWQDHVEGVQDGTDLNAANLNNIEAGTMEAQALAAMNTAFQRYGMASGVLFGSYIGKGGTGEEQVIDLGVRVDAVLILNQDTSKLETSSSDTVYGFDIRGGLVTASSPLERNNVKLAELVGSSLVVKGWYFSDCGTVNLNANGKTYNYIAFYGGK